MADAGSLALVIAGATATAAGGLLAAWVKGIQERDGWARENTHRSVEREVDALAAYLATVDRLVSALDTEADEYLIPPPDPDRTRETLNAARDEHERAYILLALQVSDVVGAKVVDLRDTVAEFWTWTHDLHDGHGTESEKNRRIDLTNDAVDNVIDTARLYHGLTLETATGSWTGRRSASRVLKPFET